MINKVRNLLAEEYLRQMSSRPAKGFREDMREAWLDGFESALSMLSDNSAIDNLKKIDPAGNEGGNEKK